MSVDNIARGLALKAPRVVAQIGVAVSHTGTTTETTLATITVPGGALGANGQLIIETLWSGTSSANNKILGVKVGATSLLAATVTTGSTFSHHIRIANRNSVSSQIANTPFSTTGYGPNSNAPVSMAVNTNADWTLTITGQLGLATETVALESYQVLAYPRI